MKPNFQYSSDWDTGIGLWDGETRYYYYNGGWTYYLLHQLFTDDIGKSGDPLAIHWAKWRTEDWSTYYLVSFWSKEDDMTLSTNRDYLYHKYEVVVDFNNDDTYFSDLTRNITNKYGYSYSLDSPVKYIYLVSDSESLSRGAIFDWIFVRRYIDISKLKQRSIFIPAEIQFIDDNPGNSDHGGDKLAILKNWKANLANYNGAWYVNTPQRYEVVVDKRENNVSLVFTHNPNIPGSAERSTTSINGNPSRYTIYAVIDNDQNNNAYFDWIVGAPYPYASYSPTPSDFSRVESNPSSNSGAGALEARAYNVEPLRLCISEMEKVGNIVGSIRYFAVPWGMSFLERLEGSNENHDDYARLAYEIQDEMGISYNGRHYPIGLVSFMIPTTGGETFDERLNKLFTLLHISPDEGVDSVDFCFLSHYFPGKLSLVGQDRCSLPAYRVYGISDTLHSGGSDVYFFLDVSTARDILGTDELLQR